MSFFTWRTWRFKPKPIPKVDIHAQSSVCPSRAVLSRQSPHALDTLRRHALAARRMPLLSGNGLSLPRADRSFHGTLRLSHHRYYSVLGRELHHDFGRRTARGSHRKRRTLAHPRGWAAQRLRPQSGGRNGTANRAARKGSGRVRGSRASGVVRAQRGGCAVVGRGGRD
jgi:hypothetical protein